MEPKRLTVALAGNPNSGKTTIFNNLTGARQHVGNYPGVTVEKKEGTRRHHDHLIRFIDLPGTYSLTAYSLEEVVTRNFIINERPDLVVDIVDASNLERNLYLAVQFLELGVPLILAFNMSDVARRRGYVCDRESLGGLLGTPIVETVGNRAEGMLELLDTIVAVADGELSLAPREVTFGRDIEEELTTLVGIIEEGGGVREGYRPRWVALKLLEADAEVKKTVKAALSDPAPLFAAVTRSQEHLEAVFGDLPEIVISDRRYGYISGACQETVKATVEARHDRSDRIDAVLANRALGLPIFAALMFLVFQLTFFLGGPPTGWLETIFSWMAEAVSSLWPKGSDSILLSLLVDGILGGVGGVVIFLPNILLLFLAIAFLEDTGYMARAAFLVDKFMHRVGLHGKSFIPMLIGFGCSVPAILATRTLENRRDRMTTILVIPLMSCGARLPIYALIIPAFFPRSVQGSLLFLIYVIGIALAMLMALLLRKTVFRGESSPFVMELPPYRMPTLRSVLMHMWERSWLYLKKAGTIILAFSILFWALYTYPRKPAFDQDYEALEAQARETYLGNIARLAPTLGPETARGLRQAMASDFMLSDAQEKAYESDPAFAVAEEAHAGRMKEILAGPGGERLGRFLAVLEHSKDLRRCLVEGTVDVEEGDPAFEAAQLRCERAMALLAEPDPSLVEGAAVFIDDIEAQYRHETETLNTDRAAEVLDYSAAGRLGGALQPALAPLGFDRRISTAIVGAFPAKELFVAQLGVVSAVGADEERTDALRSFLKRNYTPLQAFCIMLFLLVSIPCMATVAVTKRETGSWKWALFQVGGLTALAYFLTLAVYQIGILFGGGA